MLTTVVIDGVEYHAVETVLDGGAKINAPLMDDNGDYVEATVCLCYAYSSNECVCGAWDREIEE